MLSLEILWYRWSLTFTPSPARCNSASLPSSSANSILPTCNGKPATPLTVLLRVRGAHDFPMLLETDYSEQCLFSC